MSTQSSSNDPRDYLVDQGFSNYSEVDHGTWRTLAKRQREILKGRIADQFLDGLDRLAIGEAGIPDFRDLNKTLKAATGWEVVAVPGLVPDLAFFRLLADRKFPAGFWIRKPEQIDYIEEPDIFHDVFGHVPLIMQPIYADYLEAYGKAGLVAAEHGALKRLARLYWYTVEFGLARTPDGLRIVGAGIASSPSETVFALESPSPEPGRLRPRPGDAHPLPDRRFPGDLFRPRRRRGLAQSRPRPPHPALERPGRRNRTWNRATFCQRMRVLSRGDGSYHRNKAKSAA